MLITLNQGKCESKAGIAVEENTEKTETNEVFNEMSIKACFGI